MHRSVRLIAFWLGLFSATMAFADTFYVAPALVYKDVRAYSSNYKSVIPQIGVGYETNNDFYYFALEAFAEPMQGVLVKRSINPFNLNLGWSVGLSFMPGVFLDNQMRLYGRLGLIGSHFKELNTNNLGVQFGAGADIYIDAGWSVRAEYAYTQYSNISGLGRPYANQVSIGGVYRFNC